MGMVADAGETGRMIYGSVCSGIEAASVAWNPLGWRPAFLSEIEPFPRAVLAHHHSSAPLHGDFTTIQAGQYDAIDLLVGGTPCQSFSIAGLRGGLADERGNLALEYLRLADRLKPRWLLWENVPGVLSSNGGRDFGSLLGGLGQLGYGFAYRVLDAQYFGLAQRRKRVFVVGYLGDWRPAAAVLFEPESLRGHPAPRRKPGQSAAGTLSARASAGGGLGTDFECSGGVIAHTLRGEGFDASKDGTGRGTPLVVTALRALDGARGVDSDCTHTLVPVYAIQERAVCQNPDAGPDGAGFREGLAYTLEARQQVQAIAQPYTLAIRGRDGGHDLEYRQDGMADAQVVAYQPTVTFDIMGTPAKQGGRATDVHSCLRSRTPGQSEASTTTVIINRAAVRRLTPRECERLQGFPDDYTAITFRGKPAADGNRYRALGNSFAVPVVRWIGKRIAAVDQEISA